MFLSINPSSFCRPTSLKNADLFVSHSHSHHLPFSTAPASTANNKTITSGNMGNTASSNRVETLAVSSPVDMERAMSSTTLPKRVDLQASLLADKSGDVERLLKRVGCHDFCILGKGGAAPPRRVYEHEVVAAIANVKQHRLQKLVLKNLDLQRHPSYHFQYCNIQHRLSKLTDLKELHIQACRLEKDVLEDILASISGMPFLTQVTIHLRDAINPSTRLHAKLGRTMTELIGRPSLTSLAVSEYPLESEFWKHVAASSSLTHLSVAVREHMDDYTVVHPQRRQYFWDLLQRNTSLQQLEFQVAPGASLEPLYSLLSDNTTVSSLLLHLKEDPTLVKEHLTSILEHDNFTLQAVHLLVHNIYGYKVRIPSAQIDFYCRLNRHGRKHLVGEADENSTRSQEWIATLAQNTYDVPSVYYWLQANLSLFNQMAL